MALKAIILRDICMQILNYEFHMLQSDYLNLLLYGDVIGPDIFKCMQKLSLCVLVYSLCKFVTPSTSAKILCFFNFFISSLVI